MGVSPEHTELLPCAHTCPTVCESTLTFRTARYDRHSDVKADDTDGKGRSF